MKMATTSQKTPLRQSGGSDIIEHPHDKSPGQRAYEADCAAEPNYRDGAPRKAWADLCEAARWSWEREPVPRNVEARRAWFGAEYREMVGYNPFEA